MQKCNEVMKLYLTVIEQLQEMYAYPKMVDPSLHWTVKELALTYKYYRIQINLRYQLDDKAMVVEATRFAVTRENSNCRGFSAGVTIEYTDLFEVKDINTMVDGEVWTM